MRTFTFLFAGLLLNCQPAMMNQSATNTRHANTIDARPPMAAPTRNSPHEVVACKGDIHILPVEYSTEDEELPAVLYQLRWGCVSLLRDGHLLCVIYGTRGQLRHGFFHMPRDWNEW